MASTLPPDPYKALGVSRDAQLPEIRSAHRKLVLKCHPDKVQDAALKAIKQDEFQKVQQAYELLSDDSRRVSYDEQVKLFELRKEMGRGNPTARSNPFEYEIRTAEPRANTYARAEPSRSKPAPGSPKVYSRTPPRSYEDVVYEEPKAMPRKQASYESTDRKRTSTRDEERRKHEDDERLRQKFEKEKKHSAHSEKKKSRDKEKRRGTEEKHSRATAFVQDESDEYVPPRTSEKKSSRHKMEDELRQRDEAEKRERVAIKEAPIAAKWDKHKEYAAQYMQAARRKVAPVEEDFVHPGPPRRAETFTAANYSVRHVDPQQYSGDDAPRRSSARKEGRKSSEALPPRTRDKSSKASSRRSPPAPVRDPYIVEPPSPPPTARKPTLQTRSSAPPEPTSFSSSRDKPSRSKTQDYPRKDAVPPLPRAQTFGPGDRRGDRSRDRGSRLKKAVEYSSAESDSDSPAPQRRSYTPPPRRAAAPPEPTRYIIDNGRTVPVTRHRSELRDLNDEQYPRDRSESPHGRHRSRERPAAPRNTSSRAVPTRSQSQNYYPPDAPDPVVHNVRPKMPPREGSSHRSTRAAAAGGYFGEVKYATAFSPENVIYSSTPADIYRRGSDPRDHYYPHQRGGGGRSEVYA